jgi:hypothetical protein
MMMVMTYNADETSLCNSLQPSTNLTFQGDINQGGIKSKQQVTVRLAYTDDGNDKLPELAMGKYTSLCSCKMLKYFPQSMIAIQIPAYTPRYLNITLHK